MVAGGLESVEQPFGLEEISSFNSCFGPLGVLTPPLSFWPRAGLDPCDPAEYLIHPAHVQPQPLA